MSRPPGTVLQRVSHIRAFGESAQDLFAERLLNCTVDDKNGVAEAGTDCVMDRILQQSLAMRPDRSNLLNTSEA